MVNYTTCIKLNISFILKKKSFSWSLEVLKNFELDTENCFFYFDRIEIIKEMKNFMKIYYYFNIMRQIIKQDGLLHHNKHNDDAKNYGHHSVVFIGIEGPCSEIIISLKFHLLYNNVPGYPRTQKRISMITKWRKRECYCHSAVENTRV